jgi:hypothetical protein
LDHLLKDIEVIPFKFTHLPLLLEMLEDHNTPWSSKVSMKSLPKIGYIALLNKQPVAAGFLRRVECDEVAQIDCLTSNPWFGSIIRHAGVTDVVNRLIDDAKLLKLQGIIAFTKDSGVLTRAKELGFNLIDESLIVLKI